jgi:hypothetical protein
MKKWILISIVSFNIASLSFAQTIARGTYETTLPSLTDSASIGSIAAEIGSGTASGLHASATTDWSNPVGNGSAESFSANEWAIGDYYQFQTSTVGFSDIFVSWDQTRSTTGPASWDFAYSLDGSSFTIALDNYTVPSVTWSSGAPDPTLTTSFFVDLSSITALDNAPAVYFRLIADSAPGGATGTSRNDNFTVGAGPIPEPSTYALGALGLAALWFFRRRK